VTMGLCDRLAKFRDSFVADDPEPGYSALDMMDGLADCDHARQVGDDPDRPESGAVRLNPESWDTDG